MLSKYLRHLLFYLLHLLIDVLVAVQKFCQQILTKKCRLSVEKARQCEIKMLLEHMPKISKSLKHLVFLADTDNHSYHDLAQVVIWSLVAGIPCVSFHDITGKLRFASYCLCHRLCFQLFT